LESDAFLPAQFVGSRLKVASQPERIGRGFLRESLVIDVSYDLNDEPAQGMTEHLLRETMHAIGNGLLSGHTPAEVDEYNVTVKIID
jgi:hypothetical protein